MTTIYFDAPHNDEERRQRLCYGQTLVFSPYPSARALATFAREIDEGLSGALDAHDRQTARRLNSIWPFWLAQAAIH
jgi:hypothetical protein